MWFHKHHPVQSISFIWLWILLGSLWFVGAMRAQDLSSLPRGSIQPKTVSQASDAGRKRMNDLEASIVLLSRRLNALRQEEVHEQRLLDQLMMQHENAKTDEVRTDLEIKMTQQAARVAIIFDLKMCINRDLELATGLRDSLLVLDGLAEKIKEALERKESIKKAVVESTKKRTLQYKKSVETQALLRHLKELSEQLRVKNNPRRDDLSLEERKAQKREAAEREANVAVLQVAIGLAEGKARSVEKSLRDTEKIMNRIQGDLYQADIYLEFLRIKADHFDKERKRIMDLMKKPSDAQKEMRKFAEEKYNEMKK